MIGDIAIDVAQKQLRLIHFCTSRRNRRQSCCSLVVAWLNGNLLSGGAESESESSGVWVSARSQSWSLPFEGNSDFGHVLLLDCTLSLVLYSFGRCTVLVRRVTSSVSFHHATLFACTVHCCAPSIRRI